MSRNLIALADANNFYVSCERVFNPKLNNKPVAVLSNNDGCVIARSQELKMLGVKMGAPYFKYKDLFKQNKVQVLSSNYALYADLSSRMMNVLAQFTGELEIYSIDEAFLQLLAPDSKAYELTEYSRNIKETVRQWIGIPVSIGIAETKTLAKLANERAKKDTQLGGVLNFDVLSLPERDALLESFAVEDVWGIGRKRAALLEEKGITNALQLRDLPDPWILKHLTITGLRTVWELRGTSCIPMELTPPSKKAICCSKSFGKPVESLTELREAVATYVSRAAEKLRGQNSIASVMQVFIRTSFFRTDLPQYQNSATIRLPVATAYTPQLVEYATAALSKIYKSGYCYQKAGVLLTGITSENQLQLNLFTGDSQEMLSERERRQNLMKAFDKINNKFGNNTLRVASAGVGEQSWKMKRTRLSPSYTTKWSDLLVVDS